MELSITSDNQPSPLPRELPVSPQTGKQPSIPPSSLVISKPILPKVEQQHGSFDTIPGVLFVIRNWESQSIRFEVSGGLGMGVELTLEIAFPAFSILNCHRGNVTININMNYITWLVYSSGMS